jgi:hypothetical protein
VLWKIKKEGAVGHMARNDAAIGEQRIRHNAKLRQALSDPAVIFSRHIAGMRVNPIQTHPSSFFHQANEFREIRKPDPPPTEPQIHLNLNRHGPPPV